MSVSVSVSVTHSLTHSLTHPLTHSPTHSLTVSVPVPAPLAGKGYIAKDVFTQEPLFANASGFTANISGYNATLVLVQAANAD